MNFVVTGGSGFIGKSLCNKLLSEGHNVINVDINPLKNDNKNYRCFCGDLRKYDISEDFFRDCDIIIHLASVKNVLENNIFIDSLSMIDVIEKAILFKKKIIFASTSEVYGNVDKKSKEDDDLIIGNPKEIRCSYAASKLTQEFILTASNLDYLILRFFNIVGENQKSHFVFPEFTNAIKNNENLKVFGDGNQIRSFCYIEDCVNIIYKLIEKDIWNEIYNIGNDEEISIQNLAKKFIDISGKNLEIENIEYDKVFKDLDFREIYHRVPDVTKVLSDVEFTYEYDLDKIIKKMIKGY